jgi:hypothetical protein
MSITTTKVTTKWDAKKTAEVTSHIVASTWLSAFEVISKLDQKAQQEFHNLTTQHKLNHYKQMNIKNPMDLVRAIGETEHNVYGSDIEISGDENKATLKYNSCGMWNASQKLGKFTPEQEQKMGEQCVSTWSQIAKEFGFKYEPKMEKDSYEMTFSK